MLKIAKILFPFFFCLIAIAPVFAADEVVLTSPIVISSISDLATNILKTIIGLVGVIALVMFIYGGILWMTSAGSAEQIKKGKDTLLWAILGLAFIFFSYSLLQFLLEEVIILK
jgi:hypothetical protein